MCRARKPRWDFMNCKLENAGWYILFLWFVKMWLGNMVHAIVRQTETHAALIQHPKVRGTRASRTVRLVGWGERRAGQGGQKRYSCLDLDFPTHRKLEACLTGTLISHAFQVPRSRQRRKSLSYAASLPRAALINDQAICAEPNRSNDIWEKNGISNWGRKWRQGFDLSLPEM